MSKKKWFDSAFDCDFAKPTSTSQPPISINKDKPRARKSISQVSFAEIDKSKKFKSDFHPASFFNEEDDDDLMVIADDYENREQQEIRSTDWLEKFKPSKVEDLCVHPKKIEELRGWFELYDQEIEKNPNRILLITGPTGSAKTAALKLIAKSFNHDIVEWINSIDLETDLFADSGRNHFRSHENQAEKFLDFLLKSSRYGSIFNKNSRILLVKDLPNTFLRKSSEEFWEVLRQYKIHGSSPLIFILTDTNSRSLNIEYNLFPDNIKIELRIETINFNPVSSTLLKKAVKRVCSLLSENVHFKKSFNQPSQDELDDLVDQAQGDVRNAILNLNFAGQKGSGKVKLTSHKGKSKAKQKKNEKKTDKSAGMGRNEALTTMHGLGRIFYPKYELNKETNIEMLTHRPESITESFITQPRTFINLIHSNYIKNIQNIDELAELTNIYSKNDLFMTEYRDLTLHDLNLDMVIRATMVANRNPAPGFRPISGYADKKFQEKEMKNLQDYQNTAKFLNNGHLLQRGEYYCDYKGLLKNLSVFGSSSGLTGIK